MEMAYAIGAAFGGYVAGIVCGLFVHEAGHTLAAMMLGVEPRAITIGHGAILFRIRLGRVWVVMYSRLSHGIAERLAVPRSRRVARAWIVAAGPLTSLLVLVAASSVAIAAFYDLSLFAMEGALGFALAQAFLVVGSLIPRHTKVGRHPRPIATDGYKLLQFLRGDDPDELMVAYTALLRPVLLPDDGPPNPSCAAPELIYQMTRRDLLTDEWARLESAASLMRLLSEDRLNDIEKRFVRHQIGRGEGVQAPSRIAAG